VHGYRSFSAPTEVPFLYEAMMRHGLMYHGGFERNFPTLRPGATKFVGTDGSEHALQDVPPEITGVRVWYMEKAGKKFSAVRVQEGNNDVVLQNDVLIDPARHMGYGNRFSPEPTQIESELMATLMADIMAKNPEQRDQLSKIRSSFSVTGQGKK
jgi:hypothetical protein